MKVQGFLSSPTQPVCIPPQPARIQAVTCRTATGKLSEPLDRYEPNPAPKHLRLHGRPLAGQGLMHFQISSVCKEGDSCFLVINEIMLIGPPNAGLP